MFSSAIELQEELTMHIQPSVSMVADPVDMEGQLHLSCTIVIPLMLKKNLASVNFGIQEESWNQCPMDTKGPLHS